MNPFRQFYGELIGIWKNKKVLIQLIGVTLIPILYSGMFLYAFWNPYGQTGNLPVAVVNQDNGSKLSGENIQVGDTLVDILKKNNDFGWKFVDEKKAVEGFNDNKYFMIVQIPHDFSENTVSIQKNRAETAHIDYKVNQDFNYIAAKMGQSGMKEIRLKISKTITKMYIKSIYDQLGQMKDGLQDAHNNALTLSEGNKKVNQAITDLSQSLRKIEGGTLILQEGSSSLSQGGTKLYNGLLQEKKGTEQLYSQASAKAKDIQNLSEGSNRLAAELATLNTQASNLKEVNDHLTKDVSLFQGLIKPYMSKQSNGSQDLNSFSETTGQLEQTLPQISNLLNQMTNSYSNILSLLETSSQKMNESDQALFNYIELKDPTLQQDPEYRQLKEEMLNDQSTKEAINLLQFQLDEANRLRPQMIQFDNQLNELVEGLKHFDSTDKGTQKEYQNFITSIQQVQENLSRLPTITDQLSKGASQIADGNAQLNQNWDTLVSSLQKLKDGQNELTQGSGTMSRHLNDLQQGMSQLSTGIGNINQSTTPLLDGTKRLTDGSQTLSDHLGKAHDQLGSTPTDEKHANLFAKPVVLTDGTHAKVTNYGIGFAPYFLSLGLFVGGLIITVIYDLMKRPSQIYSGLSLGISQFLMMGLLGIFQACIADSIILYGLGLPVDHALYFIGFSILTSLTFVTIIQFLTVGFGNYGRFIAVLLLILQLTTSGGTYAIELLPTPLQLLPNWLPMTYTINGFKNIIAGQYHLLANNVIVLIILIVAMFVLTQLVYIFKYRDVTTNKEVNMDTNFS
ncbi:YhgE/Pip domain-containing protein [Terrilactibacillus tamarindi]|nr:YhgE/Pip domain-containing protein [Terrilactibacillus tamarindi]